jgi:hypothetical protein
VGFSGLLGREFEVATIRTNVEGAPDQGSVTLLVGEPGIGKSALLTVASDAAREARFALLEVYGVETEMHLPFGGLQQLLAPLMESIDTLPAVQREALETAMGLSAGSPPELFLIAEAAFSLIVSERRQRPVIIVVDDVQWLDPQSHQILAFLAYRSVVGCFSLIGAMRTDHPGPLADGDFPKLEVGGLDEQTSEQLLAASTSSLTANELRAIKQEAAGNPLALLELPRSWGEGPANVDHPPALSARLEYAFAGRVADLPPESQDALLLAAVSSSSETAEILAAMEAFGYSSLSSRVLEPAVVAGLITKTYSTITFRHPLVRSGVLQRESLDRRHAAHRALADVLTTDRYRKSWHRAWSIVGPDDDIAEELAATVPDTLRRGAVMAAVSSLERSARLTASPMRRSERLLQAALYAFGAGRADVVARILREASEVDLTELDQARFSWLTEALNGDVAADSASVRSLVRNAELAISLDDGGLALDLLLSAAFRIWWADSGADDGKRVLGALDRFTQGKNDPRHTTAIALTEPLLRSTEVDHRLKEIGLNQIADGNVLRVYGIAAYAIGDLPLATQLLGRAESIFRDQGRLGLLPVVLALQVHIRIDLGEWAAAAAATDEVYSVSLETGQAVFAQNNVLVEARGRALRGEWEAALELMASAESDAFEQRVDDRICLSYLARGAALLAADRPAEAFDCLKRPYDPNDPGYHLRESIGGLALMVEAAVESQHTDEACRIIASFETLFVLAPSPLLEVNLLYSRASLAPHHLREGLFYSAMEHDLTNWPWVRGRLQLEFGCWLLGSGRGPEARPHLTEALSVFQSIGAPRWSRRATAALDYLERPTDGRLP